MPDQSHHLTSGRILARNTIWNLLGQAAPLVAAVLVIPSLLRGLGQERFGLLALAWVIIGYFGVLDLGVGRALTKLAAEKLGLKEGHELGPLVGTSLLLLAAIGVLGGVCGFALSNALLVRMLKMSPALRTEALHSFWLLCVSVPVITVTTGLRGILEAQQRFLVLNAIRVPLSVFNFVAPALLLPYSTSLLFIVAVLLAGRLLALAAHWTACVAAMPSLRRPQFDRGLIRPLLALGGWMMVSNVISPIMVYIDRFLLGALASVDVIPYYVVPYEVVSKLLLIPAAIVSVLFPAFSTTLARERGRATLLASRSTTYLIVVIFPLVMVLVTLASNGLGLWMGPAFSQMSFRILQLLAVGVFLNCLAQVPFTLIQAAGRPDLTAKLHLLEFPFYMMLAWRLIGEYGALGAALAWVLRVSVDAVLLFVTCQWLLNREAFDLRKIVAGVTVLLCVLAVGAFVSGLISKLALLLVVLLPFLILAWRRLLQPAEKSLLLEAMKGARSWNQAA